MQAAAIEAFKESGTILAACTRLKIDRHTFYEWMKEPLFEKEFIAAQEVVTERCEHAAMARAVNGVERTVYYKGAPIMEPVLDAQGRQAVGTNGKPLFKKATYKEYSDHLLIKLLEARNPQKYSQRVNGEFKLDVRIYAEVLTDILNVIRARVPSACPHCKNVLGISENLATDLKQLSKKFEGATTS